MPPSLALRLTLFAALSVAPLHAQMFVKAGATGANDGTSWADAYPHLQSALANSSSGDQIWIAEGIYYPDQGTGQTDNARTSSFTLVDGVALYGGFPNDGSATLLNDRDPLAHPTTLSGEIQQDGDHSNNAYHVVFADASDTIGSSTILDGFTITGGNADKATPPFIIRGGGLYLESASPSVANCLVEGNGALDGAAIYIASGTPTISNCILRDNHADFGGGLYFANASPTILNCSLQGNSAAFRGGAVYNQSASPFFTNCTLLGNRATNLGGGVFNDNSSPSFTNCSFQGNHAPLGGAIRHSSGAGTTLVNCILWQNAEGGDTTSTGASVAIFTGTVSYSHCLVANSGGSTAWVSDLGVDNGNNIDVNPLFVSEVDPLTAPHPAGGDLRLLTGSPAIEAGDGSAGNSANLSTTDLAGTPRFAGVIDLGPFEGGAGVTFALLYPTLDPLEDENQNGVSNFADYAAGGDPTAADHPSLHQVIGNGQITFPVRNNALDVSVELQKSTSLLPESWEEMTEGIDYTVDNTTESGTQTLLTLDLTISGPARYFRQGYFVTP